MRYPHWIVKTVTMRRDYDQLVRSGQVPRAFARRLPGAMRTTESTFDDVERAKLHALESGFSGDLVESFVVERPGSCRRPLRLVGGER